MHPVREDRLEESPLLGDDAQAVLPIAREAALGDFRRKGIVVRKEAHRLRADQFL